MSDGVYKRRSARVLVIDASGRVLLFRCVVDTRERRLGYGWTTPGGGVDDGETLQQAAAREVREETGLVVEPSALGEPVAYTAGYADLEWASGVFRDDLFQCRVEEFDVDMSSMEERERSAYLGHRWWTVDELDATTDIVYPFGLAPLLADLLAGRVPPAPVELPWHH